MPQLKPLLAGKAELDKIKYPCYVSHKLDGVRALIVNGIVMSRTLKPIPNKHVQALFGRKEYNGLDGELIVGPVGDKDVYTTTVSGVMSVEGEPDVTFCVFDNYLLKSYPFIDRHEILKTSKIYSNKKIKFVGQHVANNEFDILSYEKICLEYGFEGVMIRSFEGLYKYGRSTQKEGILLKLKRFEDSEAEIIDFEPLMHNNNEATTNELGAKTRSSKKSGKVVSEKLGALNVIDIKTGVVFDIGSGFTDEQRVTFWKNKEAIRGNIVKYKFQPAGVKDKPRFPVFLGFRSTLDL